GARLRLGAACNQGQGREKDDEAHDGDLSFDQWSIGYGTAGRKRTASPDRCVGSPSAPPWGNSTPTTASAPICKARRRTKSSAESWLPIGMCASITPTPSAGRSRCVPSSTRILDVSPCGAAIPGAEVAAGAEPPTVNTVV